MTSISVILDDFASAWTYSAGWVQRDGVAKPFPSGNVAAGRYVDSSYHSTVEQNATASLLFAGTSLSVYGRGGAGSGYYTVQLDDEATSAPISAFNNSMDDSQDFVYWSSSTLTAGDHNLTFTNLGNLGNATLGTGILIDYARLEAVGGAQGATLTNTTVEDNDRTRLTYEGTWSSNEDERFSGGTSTFTNNTATVTFKFNGSAVYVYGDTVNDHGLFTVTLDGVSRQYQGRTDDLKFDTLKFFEGGLDASEHTLAITNNAVRSYTSTNSFFDLDSIVYTTPSEYASLPRPTGSPTASSASTPPSASSSTRPSSSGHRSKASTFVLLLFSVGVTLLSSA